MGLQEHCLLKHVWDNKDFISNGIKAFLSVVAFIHGTLNCNNYMQLFTCILKDVSNAGK